LPKIQAQQHRIDSLERVLLGQVADSVKIDIMVTMATLYQDIEPSKTLEIAQNAYSLSKNINDKKRKALALNRLGIGHWALGNLDKALNYYQQSIALAQTLRDENLIARNMTNAGLVYSTIGNNKLALDYHLKALKTFEKLRINDRIVTTLGNVGDIYKKIKLYDSAKIISLKAISLAEKNYPVFLPRLYIYMAETAIMEQKYNLATSYLQKALEFAQNFDNERNLSTIYKLFAIIALNEKNLSKAKEYIALSIKLAVEIKAKEQIHQSYDIFSKILFEQKDYKKAYHLKALSEVYRDSLEGETIRKALQVFEYERKKGELTMLKQETLFKEQNIQRKVNMQQWIIFLAIISLLFFGVVIMLIYRSRKNIKIAYYQLSKASEEIQQQKNQIEEKTTALLESNKALQMQKEEIQALNEHLETIVEDRTNELGLTVQNLTKQNQDLEQFSYIISHNLRAPLARIMGLLNIFNYNDMNDAFNKQILLHLKQSSSGLDEIVRDLTNIIAIRKSFTINQEVVYINEIISYEITNMSDEIRESNAIITQNITVTEVYGIKVYIQSIIHNLLSNAIKYKHNSRTPVIEIKTYTKDKNFYLICKDNGLGVDIENLYKIFGLYQRMHTHVEGKGLGLYLVKTQVEAMNGKIEIQSEVNEGTTFIISLPYLIL
jgi:signal transduction histidine kinase